MRRQLKKSRTILIYRNAIIARKFRSMRIKPRQLYRSQIARNTKGSIRDKKLDTKRKNCLMILRNREEQMTRIHKVNSKLE